MLLVSEMHGMQLVRSAICMAVTLGLLRLHAVSPMFGHAKSYFALLVRGGAGATSMSVYYFAIMALPLADVVGSLLLLLWASQFPLPTLASASAKLWLQIKAQTYFA